MADRWKGSGDPTTLGRKAVAITPSGTDLTHVAKTVVALDGGDITLLPVDNADADLVTFTGVSPGWSAPFQVRRVTAATGNFIAIYD